MTLAERKSRIYLTRKVLSKDTSAVSNAIISMLSSYKDVCHTLTFDNGGEFSEHKAISVALGDKTYFAHPYAPHERGPKENTNNLLAVYPAGNRPANSVRRRLTTLSWRAEQQAT